MANITKPDCLILPPEFIYSDEFHYAIKTKTSDDVLRIYEYERGHLWFHMIDWACGRKLIRVIKGFCQSIYGICIVRQLDMNTPNLFTALLYLDNMSHLPLNLIDKSYHYELLNKYHCYMPRRLNGEEYRLISSRKNVDG